MTTMDCMHRFCEECIVTSLRLSSKECPTCRTRLPSKRNLRRDPNFDALVRAVYPNRQQAEAREEAAVAQITEAYDHRKMSEKVEAGLARQGRAAPPKREEMEVDKPKRKYTKRGRKKKEEEERRVEERRDGPKRVKLRLERNPAEGELKELKLSCVTLAEEAPVRVLVDIVQRWGGSEEQVVLSAAGGVRVPLDATAAQVAARGGRLQYQTAHLARHMALADW